MVHFHRAFCCLATTALWCLVSTVHCQSSFLRAPPIVQKQQSERNLWNKAQGRYIVLYDDNTALGQQQRSAASLTAGLDATVRHEYATLLSGFSITDASPEAVQQLQDHPGVAAIVPDDDAAVHVAAAATARDDYDVVRQQRNRNTMTTLLQQTTDLPWSLDRIDEQGVDGVFEYPAHGGQDVHLYVLDTGIDVTHKEFAGRIATEHANFVDDDHNNNNDDDDDDVTETPDPAHADCHGHGTHVASVAAGTFYGVAKQATLHSVRVLDCDGDGSRSAVLAGLEWVAAQCTNNNNNNTSLCVAQLSFTSAADNDNTILNNAVSALVASGVSVVVAAGNQNDNACDYAPASAAGVISVAATDQANDTRTETSNFGACVDLFAPGENIVGADFTCINCNTTKNGTSAAAAYVAGVTALLLQDQSDRGDATFPAVVKDRLLSEAAVGVVQDAGLASPDLFLQLITDASEPPSLTPTTSAAPTTSAVPSLAPSESAAPSADPTIDAPSSSPSTLECPAGLGKMDLQILTDFWGPETSVSLVDRCRDDKAILDIAADTLDGNTFYSFVECLPLFGGYEFLIQDAAGDGIYAPGYYALYWQNAVVAQNDRFGASDAAFFGDDDCVTETPTVSNVPSLAPTDSVPPSDSAVPSAVPSILPSAVPSAAPSLFTCPNDGDRMVQIEIQTDQDGGQTKWDLLDRCRNVLIGQTSYDTYESNQMYIVNVCVEANVQLEFTVWDLQGDGITAPGYVRVLLDDVEVMTTLDDEGFDGRRREFIFGDDCPAASCPCDQILLFWRILCKRIRYPDRC